MKVDIKKKAAISNKHHLDAN